MNCSNISIGQATELQVELSKRVIIGGAPLKINYIAAADIAYINNTDNAVCVIAVFSYPQLKLLSIDRSSDTISFPYVAGLLSFRESPLIISTYGKLKIKPDVIFIDGHGIAHPRRFGMASHIGLILNLPSIGCAKSLLYGTYKEPGMKKGSQSPIYGDYHKPIGTVLRSRENVKPVFISPGHLVGIHESTQIIMNCLSRYRIPEPLRCADIEARRLKKTGY